MATVKPNTRSKIGLPVEGDVVAGRYRVESLLGRGGFGAVFRVTHTGTGQQCALKILAIGDSDDQEGEHSAVRRFFAEARATASLKHINTVRVFDFGQDDRGWYYLCAAPAQTVQTESAGY